MATGGRISMKVDFNTVQKNLLAAISKVERGTKRATTAACQEILQESLAQVPRLTETLASSGFYQIEGKYKNFTGVVGYGGNGNPINPKTGQPVTNYMVVVHEDLSVHHPVGKAKFLEDPVRAYAQKFGPRAAAQIARELV